MLMIPLIHKTYSLMLFWFTLFHFLYMLLIICYDYRYAVLDHVLCNHAVVVKRPCKQKY